MSQPQQFISYQKGMEHTRQNVDMPTYVPPSPVAPAAAVPDTMDERMSLLDRYNDLKAKEPKKFKEDEGVRTKRKTITDEWNKWNEQFEPYDEFYNDLQVYKLTQ